MNNIEHLLDNGITVNLRMNFDVENFHEFEALVQETYKRFGNRPLFHLHAHPVNGEYKDRNGVLSHGSESWFNERLAELNGFARRYGLLHNPSVLPCLRFDGCIASDRSAIVITPDGDLARCPEQFDSDCTIGNLTDGITCKELAESWNRLADHARCANCEFFPYCDRLKNCSAQDRCGDKLDYLQKYQASMNQYFRSYIERIGGI
jgi:radical SAM protein with 4Fe4S-binding SPASM domain